MKLPWYMKRIKGTKYIKVHWAYVLWIKLKYRFKLLFGMDTSSWLDGWKITDEP